LHQHDIVISKNQCRLPIQNWNDNIDIGDLSQYSRLIDPHPARN